MYQKKLIERREKQVHIINKQILQKSDSQHSARVLHSYAISSTGRYDSNENTADLVDRGGSKQSADQSRSKVAKRLETLRKIQDLFSKTSKRTRNKKQVLSSVRERKNLVGKSKTGSEFQRPTDSSYEKQIYSSCNSKIIAGGTSLESNVDAFLEENTLLQQSVISDNTFQSLYQDAIGSDQQAGFKLTNESSQGLGKPGDSVVQGEEQGTIALKLNTQNSFPLRAPDSVSNSRSFSKPFKIPKIKATPLWQNVIEKSYNMVQVEDETYEFVPGKISKNLYQVGSKGPNLSTQPRLRQKYEFSLEKTENPTDRSPEVQARKKSHELNLIRNQAITDEDRIKKLTNFSISRQLKRQRNQLSISGRDDPSNLLGYEKLGISFPKTMRGHGTRIIKRNQDQLNPLPTRGELNSKIITADKLTSTVQKNIYGMLSYLSRAKTVRIANQVLKEQQQQMYSVQKRREQVFSQGNQKVSSATKKQNRLIEQQLPKNRPQLLIQTVPKLPPLLTNSSNFSASSKQQTALFQKSLFPQNHAAYLAQEFQAKDSITDSIALASRSDFQSKGFLQKQGDNLCPVIDTTLIQTNNKFRIQLSPAPVPSSAGQNWRTHNSQDY